MATDLKTQMLERLLDCGTWVMRHDLVEGLSNSPPAIEDALADLVIEGFAEYRQAAGYRLAGSALARRAARMLRRSRTARAVCGKQVGNVYQVGVAEMRQLGASAALSLVMFDMSLPMPPDGPEHLEQHMQQINGVMAFAMHGVAP
jgi:hypothetical protein